MSTSSKPMTNDFHRLITLVAKNAAPAEEIVLEALQDPGFELHGYSFEPKQDAPQPPAPAPARRGR